VRGGDVMLETPETPEEVEEPDEGAAAPEEEGTSEDDSGQE